MGKGTIQSENPGLAIDMINAAAAMNNVEVKYRRFPNARVLFLLRQGMIDGAFMFSFTEQRSAYSSYPIQNGELDADMRIGSLSYYVYKKSDSSFKLSPAM